MKAKKLFGFILIGLLLTGSAMGIGYGMSAATKSAALASAPASALAGTQMVPANFSELAEKVRSGVVNIQVTKKISNAAFRSFPGNPLETETPSATSSAPSRVIHPRGNSRELARGSS